MELQVRQIANKQTSQKLLKNMMLDYTVELENSEIVAH